MTEINGDEIIRVNVYSEYWDGRIEVEMSEKAYETPGLQLVGSIDQIIEKAKHKSMLWLDSQVLEDLKNRKLLRFERASDVSKENEPAVFPADDTTVTRTAPDPSQQEIPYERPEPESAYHSWGNLNKDEIDPDRRHAPGLWR